MSEPRTPEGQLLMTRLVASGQSVRKAAAAIDLSDTRLRHIINGRQPVGGGQQIEITAPAATLARVAHHLNIQPAELREVGREDAADILAKTLRDPAERDDPRLSEASLDELLDEVALRRAPRLSGLEREASEVQVTDLSMLPTAARDIGERSPGQQRRDRADEAGEPPGDDPGDLEPR